MRLMARQSLLQQLLATATSRAADVGRHMTPPPPFVVFFWFSKLRLSQLMVSFSVFPFPLQTTMRLMKQQSLLQQLLSTATSLAADVGRHMTPHHKGLPASAEAAAAALMGLAAGYRHRFLNRINAFRCALLLFLLNFQFAGHWFGCIVAVWIFFDKKVSHDAPPQGAASQC
jgi:hypothetical protein